MQTGDVNFEGSDKMVYTPLLRKPGVHYYTVSLDLITVGGKDVNVPSVRPPLHPFCLWTVLSF